MHIQSVVFTTTSAWSWSWSVFVTWLAVLVTWWGALVTWLVGAEVRPFLAGGGSTLGVFWHIVLVSMVTVTGISLYWNIDMASIFSAHTPHMNTFFMFSSYKSLSAFIASVLQLETSSEVCTCVCVCVWVMYIVCVCVRVCGLCVCVCVCGLCVCVWCIYIGALCI